MQIEREAAAVRRMKPRITISAEDYERLLVLANAAMNRMPDLASGLVEELERAQVLAKDHQPKNIVRMGSIVQFRDNATGRVQTITLVYPGEADISKGTISVLTPVGTALIGLQAGHSIAWEAPGGEARELTVLNVL